MGVEDYYVSLSNAKFGLYTDDDGFAFEFSEGEFDLALGPIANFSAESVFVRYSSRDEDFDAQSINVGPVAYTFESAIAAGEIAFAVEGFAADIAGAFSFGGFLGFRKVGEEIQAIGQQIYVSVGNDEIGLHVANASFGLIAGEGLALEVTGGSLDLNLGGVANLSFDDLPFNTPTKTLALPAAPRSTSGR